MLRTETYTLNMGPQHPSTHGVLQVQLELDGVGQLVPLEARLGGPGPDLLVDVGDVGDDPHLVAARREPTAQDVEDDLLADVPQVR